MAYYDWQVLEALQNIGRQLERIAAPEKAPSTECRLFNQVEIYPDCTVQILRNSFTGAESVGWWENKHEQ